MGKFPMLSRKNGYKIRAKVHGKGGYFLHQQTSIRSTFGLDCREGYQWSNFADDKGLNIFFNF